MGRGPAGYRPSSGSPDSPRGEPSDLYELLEISPRASQAVIQAAYRALVRDSHPDLNETAAAGPRIRALNAAYSVLSDPSRRAEYDLEQSRQRRHDRIVSSQSASVLTSVVARAPSQLAVRATPVVHVSERPALMNAQVLLALLIVFTLASVLFLTVWFSLDPGGEPTGPSSMSFELVRH